MNIQSDAALRQVATRYNYDNNEGDSNELTLRSGGEEINEILENHLNERLAMAGIEVVEARINYLAYAPEIAAVMLRRQQADAIIAAREKIVEGAVSMVKMAIDQLSEKEIVELDEVCRMQQVNDGCFEKLDDVPKCALTLTIPTLVSCKYNFCVVPAKTKADAVKNTVLGEISEKCPATILRRKDNAILYCDFDSSVYIREV